MRLYCGIDLHSTNSYLAVLNERLESVLDRRVPNRLEAVLGALEPFRAEVRAVAVESTFNWYWLVDGLMEEGYSVDLVNTSAVNRYEGLKYVDDRHDARWLARLLHLGILPTGHIYPKQERAVRDLLRRRAFLVRDRTAHLLSVKNLYSRNTGAQVAANELKRLTDEQVTAQFSDPHLALAITSRPGRRSRDQRGDRWHREAHLERRQAEARIRVAEEHPRDRTDPGPHDHVRDWLDSPLCRCRSLQ